MRKIKRRIVNKLKREIKKSKDGSQKKENLIKLYKNSLMFYYRKKMIDKAYTTIDKYEPKNEYTKSQKRDKVKDIFYYKHFYGSSITEYYLFDLPNHTIEEVENFVFNKTRKVYLRYLNTDIRKVTKNKYDTYKYYKEYFKREVELIDENSYDKYEDFIKKHPVFVKKPTSSSLGNGVELIDSNKENKKELFDKLIEENGKFIMEEKIEQGKEMKKLNSSSVNTIRVVPFMKDGKCIIHLPFMKVGQNGSFVDNGGAGGILVLLDAESGVAITDGVDENLKRYKLHPNSKIKFKGFKVPKWDELKSIAEKLVDVYPQGRYIGYDFAYSTNGWVVVEANGQTQFIGQQMTTNKGVRKELEELIDWESVPNKEQYNRKQKEEIVEVDSIGED